MKKIFCIVVVTILFFGLSITAGDYGDLKDFLGKQIVVFEKFIKESEAVKDAKDVVKMINNFKDGMIVILPEAKKLSEKYSNFGKMMKTNPPEALKEQSEKLKELMQKMMKASMSIMQYAQDPDVMAAQMEFQKVMMEFSKLGKKEEVEKEKEE
jgi:5'-3' exonuclease